MRIEVLRKLAGREEIDYQFLLSMLSEYAHPRDRVHRINTIKIKMEVDINPPGTVNTEVKNILLPIPFSIKTLTQPDLFAGKCHATLCRPWQKRVKGRDWYDLNLPEKAQHTRQYVSIFPVNYRSKMPADGVSLSE